MLGAIDIGGTKIALGIVDMQGQVFAKLQFPTATVPEPETGTQHIAALLAKMVQQTGVTLDGIGIGLTGPVNPKTGVMGKNEFLKQWTGFNLVAYLQNLMTLPVAIENDADAAALAEATWGVGNGSRRFIYITISTGIGGGIILDGTLYRGVDGAHPEMGHQVIDPSGPLCFCGARGCWESLASGRALAAWYKENAAPDSLMPEPLDAACICELAQQGDELACRAVERETFYLGTGLANLITVLTPDTIALGGGMMKSWPLFADRVRAVIRQNCGLVPSAKTHLECAALGIDVGLIGAACTWLHHFRSEQFIV